MAGNRKIVEDFGACDAPGRDTAGRGVKG